jgi:hypothetical protein
MSIWLSVFFIYRFWSKTQKRGRVGGLCLVRANRESGQGYVIKRPFLWSASTQRNLPKLVFPSGHHFYCSTAHVTASFTRDAITKRLFDNPAFICYLRIQKERLNVGPKWNRYFSFHFIDTARFLRLSFEAFSLDLLMSK